MDRGERGLSRDLHRRGASVSQVPFKATRVVKAVDDGVLSGGLKAVFLEMYGLDNGPMGCSATATRLAKRLGLSPRTVDDVRRELVELGLAYKVSGSNGWHLTMPTDCMPASDRPLDEDVYAAAQRLAAYLRPDRETPAHKRGASGRVPIQRRGESPTRSGVEPVQRRGFEKAVSPSLTEDSEADRPRQGDGSVPVRLEVLEKLEVTPPTSHPPSEVGSVAHANPKVGKPQPFTELLPPEMRDELQRRRLLANRGHQERRVAGEQSRAPLPPAGFPPKVPMSSLDAPPRVLDEHPRTCVACGGLTESGAELYAEPLCNVCAVTRGTPEVIARRAEEARP